MAASAPARRKPWRRSRSAAEGKVRPRGELGPGRGGRAAPGQRGRRDVEHRRPQDRHARAARVAEQDAVADVQWQRVAEHQPGDRRSPRRAKGTNPGLRAGGADVQGHLGRQPHLGGLREPDVHQLGQRPAACLDQGHAARREAGRDAAEVDRDARDAGDRRDRLVQRFQAPDPGGPQRWGKQQFLAGGHRPGRQRAGDDGAAAPDAERPVHPKPDRGGGVGRGQRRH